jgi:hypothetical protein
VVVGPHRGRRLGWFNNLFGRHKSQLKLLSSTERVFVRYECYRFRRERQASGVLDHEQFTLLMADSRCF